MIVELIFPAFLAGLLTFLMPCTLPLVPGYLSFISGVSAEDLGKSRARFRIFLNGLSYVFGFSIIFILFGSVLASVGFFVGVYRPILGRLGGFFIALVGLYMIGLIRMPTREISFLGGLATKIKPGSVVGSFLFGALFALGWTPCIGPILGTIFTLSLSAGGAAEGAILLSIFSLGLAIPFLFVALFIGFVVTHLTTVGRVMRGVSFIGGILLLCIGLLLLTDRFGWWIEKALSLMPYASSEWFLNRL